LLLDFTFPDELRLQPLSLHDDDRILALFQLAGGVSSTVFGLESSTIFRSQTKQTAQSSTLAVALDGLKLCLG
jgi:hypothetical protein